MGHLKQDMGVAGQAVAFIDSRQAILAREDRLMFRLMPERDLDCLS